MHVFALLSEASLVFNITVCRQVKKAVMYLPHLPLTGVVLSNFTICDVHSELDLIQI